MAEITRRTRRRGRHRSHTIEPQGPGPNGDVSTTRPAPINRDMNMAPVPISPMPESLLDFVHIHLSSARDSNIALRRYLIIFFALIAGVLLLAGGVYVVIAAAGVHLWSALLLGVGGTFAPITIARKLPRKRE